MIADHLSRADLGLSPDLKTPLNDVSTMNKTMEYMAYALPSVSFDLVETRVSGGDSVVYVPSGDVLGFADAVERLLDNPERRRELGLRARERVATELDWRQQAVAYVGVFNDLAGEQRDLPVESVSTDQDARGRRYVPADDLERFVIDRTWPAYALPAQRTGREAEAPRAPGRCHDTGERLYALRRARATSTRPPS